MKKKKVAYHLKVAANAMANEMVLACLDQFAKLERKATDEIGWVALKFGKTREEATKMIASARKETP